MWKGLPSVPFPIAYILATTSALATTRQLEFHIVFVQLVNVSLS